MATVTDLRTAHKFPIRHYAFLSETSGIATLVAGRLQLPPRRWPPDPAGGLQRPRAAARSGGSGGDPVRSGRQPGREGLRVLAMQTYTYTFEHAGHTVEYRIMARNKQQANTGAVEPGEGTQRYLVASQSDPPGLTVYDVHCGTLATCTCEAYTRHAPHEPDYRCKHIVAVWIYRRAMAQTTPAPVASAATCPEAATSLCLKGQIGGIEAQLTVRGQSPEAFQRNLEAVRSLLNAPASQPPAPAAAPGEDRAAAAQPPGQALSGPWCALHSVPLQEQRNQRGTWWSHRLPEGGWCKGN